MTVMVTDVVAGAVMFMSRTPAPVRVAPCGKVVEAKVTPCWYDKFVIMGTKSTRITQAETEAFPTMDPLEERVMFVPVTFINDMDGDGAVNPANCLIEIGSVLRLGCLPTYDFRVFPNRLLKAGTM